MARTMIAGIHDDELILKSVRPAKVYAPVGVVPYHMIVRPGGEDRNFGLGDPFILDPLRHDSIERNYKISITETVEQHFLKAFGCPGALPKPTGRYCLVRVEVHNPKAELATLNSNEESPNPRNQRRRGHRYNQIEMRKSSEMDQTI